MGRGAYGQLCMTMDVMSNGSHERGSGLNGRCGPLSEQRRIVIVTDSERTPREVLLNVIGYIGCGSRVG
jgi:hypothetical protein